MFRRKNVSKGTKGRGSAKAKKIVKRLLEKPSHDRMAEIADLAMRENLLPFRASLGSEVGDAGACAAVAKVMAMYPDDRLIQKEGCRAIEALSDGDERNVERLGEANCCQLVEMVLAKFPDDSSLQTQGCRAVTNLFNGEANMKQFGRGKACELVTATLRNFPRNHEVQIEACGAVANLANNFKENRNKLGSIGACELVAESMGVFPTKIDVQHAACVAVGNLANRHAENKRRLGAAGACNKVCAALASFQSDRGVQYMACGAVGNLSHSNPQNCTRLGEAGGCVLITMGMNTFPEDRDMQHVGCAAVANLAIGNTANTNRLLKAGAKVAVQRAMDQFDGDLDIQTRGSQALQWLTVRPTHRASHSQKNLMKSEGDQPEAALGTLSQEDSARGKENAGHRRASSVRDVRMKHRGGAEQPDTFMTDTDATACGGEDGDDDMTEDNDDGKEKKEGDDEEDDEYTSTEGDESDSESSATESEEYSEEVDGDSCSASGMSSVGSRRRSSKPKAVSPPAGKRSTSQSASTPPSSSMPASTRSSTLSTSALSSVPTSTSASASASIPDPAPISTSTSMATTSTTARTAAPATAATTSTPTSNSASTTPCSASEPKGVRPSSKAELPMGPLLEDFDSDGNGDYGPAPNASKSSSAPNVPREDGPDPGKAVAASKSARPAKSTEVAGGGRVAVGPSPPSVQAPTPGVLTSGGDPAAPQDEKSSRPLEPTTSSGRSPSAGTTSDRGRKDSAQTSRSYGVAAGGDPAKKAREEGSGRDRSPGDMADVGPSVPSASFLGKSKRVGGQDAARQRERRRSSPVEHGVVGGVGVRTGNAGGVSPSAAPRRYRRGSTGEKASADVGGKRTGAPSNSDTSSSTRVVNWQGKGGDAGVSKEVALDRDAGGGREGRAESRAGLVPGEEDRGQRPRGSSTSTIDPATSRDGRWRGDAEERHEATVGQHPHAFSVSEERPRKPKVSPTSTYQQPQHQQQPVGSTSNQASFDSGKSSRSGGRRHITADELLREPAVASAPEVAKLLRCSGDEISLPLTTVIGKDPALLPGMVANVEKLLRRTTEMETLMQQARVKVMTSEASPVSDSLRRREYFDTLYRGVCGGHIGAAVVANGGIMADSKDGWLRKASALVKVIAKASPTVRDGMGLLGRTLQMSDRAKMADYLEQVAKASRSPSDVSALVESTALRLLAEGRAETDAASVDALRASESLSEEWLPAWLLEEGGLRGKNGHARDIADSFMFGGLPGTESARKAALADGCCIVKAVGMRNLRNIATQEDKINVLVEEVQRNAAAAVKAAAAANAKPKAAKAARGTTRGPSQPVPVAVMMATPMPPSVASTAYYPPASPSTLPPGQGVAPSPTGSGIGAIRRAEANGKIKPDGGQGEAWEEEMGSKGFPRAAAVVVKASGRYGRVPDGGVIKGERRRASTNAHVSADLGPSRSSERRSSDVGVRHGGDKSARAAAPVVDTGATRGFEQEVEQDRDSLEGIGDEKAETKPRAAGIVEVEGLGKVDVDESLPQAEMYYNRKRKKTQRGRAGTAIGAATAASVKANGVRESGAAGLGNGDESSSWDTVGDTPSSGGLQGLVDTTAREGKSKGGTTITEKLASLVRTAVPGRNGGGGAVEANNRATPGGDNDRSRSAHRRKPSFGRSRSRSRSRSVAPQEPRSRPSSPPPGQAPAISKGWSAVPQGARSRPSSPQLGHTRIAGQAAAVGNKTRSRSLAPQEARARSPSPPSGQAPAMRKGRSAVPQGARSRPSSPPQGHTRIAGQAAAVGNKPRSRSLAPQEARARPPSPPSGHAPAVNRSRFRPVASQGARGQLSSPPPGDAPVVGHAPAVSRSRSRSVASRGTKGRPSSPPPGNAPVTRHAPVAGPKGEAGRQQRLGSEKDTHDLSLLGGGNGGSPASSKASTGSRLSNFFSGSNKNKLSMEEAARDSFGSSDGTDTAEVLFTNVRGHRRRGSRGSSSSSVALSKETYSVATKEASSNGSGAPRPTHGRSGSTAHAGEIGKMANSRVGGNRGSSGPSA